MLYNNHYKGADDLASSPYVCMYRAAKEEKKMYRVTDFNANLATGHPSRHLSLIVAVLSIFLLIVLLGHFAILPSLPIISIPSEDGKDKITITASDMIFSTLKGFGIKISDKQDTYFHQYFLDKGEVEAEAADEIVDGEATETKAKSPIFGYIVLVAVLGFILLSAIALIKGIMMLTTKAYSSLGIYFILMAVLAFVGMLSVYIWSGEPIDRFRDFVKGANDVASAGLGIYIMLLIAILLIIWANIYLNASKRKNEYDAMVEAVNLEERRRKELADYMNFNQTNNMYALPYQPYGPIKRP